MLPAGPPRLLTVLSKGRGGGSSFLASDNFDRADSTNLGNVGSSAFVWVEYLGQWSISSNALRNNTLLQTENHVGCDFGIANARILVPVRTSPTADRSNSGILFRRSNDTNFLIAVMADTATLNGAYLYKCVAGVYTLLGSWTSTPIVPSTTYSMEVVVSGSSIIVKVDSVERINVSDGFNSGATIHGMRQNTNLTTNDDSESRFIEFAIAAA